MEVGRVGDLKIREGSIEPPAWSAISCLDGRTKNLSKKERRKIIYASRWSAVGYCQWHGKQKVLDRDRPSHGSADEVTPPAFTPIAGYPATGG